MLQGAAICEGEGFPLDAFLTALKGFMPVIEDTLNSMVGRIHKRHFAADATTTATVEICHASVRCVLEMSKEHGIDRGLPEALDRIFRRTGDAGHAQGDLSALYQAMR